MFIGHFGVGFGAKKFAPGVSLGVLFIAAQFLDLLWPCLVLLGVEHVVIAPGITRMTPLDFTHYPVSHSLVMAVAWGALLGVPARYLYRSARVGWLIFVLVVSHWVLDLLVHRPDLPLTPWGDARAGFGLWNYPFWETIVEGTVFLGGVILYTRATTAKNGFGRYGLATLVALFIVTQTANMLGPPPPNVAAIAWAGQLQWLFVLLAYFVDKNREATGMPPEQAAPA